MQLNLGIYSICIGVIDLSNNEILTRNDSVAYVQAMTKYASWANYLIREMEYGLILKNPHCIVIRL